MIKIPHESKGKELTDFLVANKSELIQQKCAFPIKSEPNQFPYELIKRTKANASKAEGQGDSVDLTTLDVTCIGNSANWIDSQLDMLLPDCWKKTIKERGTSGKIYHLRDHKQSTEGIIGKPSAFYSKDYSLAELGLEGFYGNTQCLVMDSTLMESLDEKLFALYSNKMIKQHSIGMQYVKLDLAINDPNSPDEFAVWNKYFAQAINKDVATQCGYFWVVYEIKLLEVSAVLWGANELTPTIESENKSEPLKDTQKNNEPPISTQKSFTEMLGEIENIVKL